jgi:hypothetical protein
VGVVLLPQTIQHGTTSDERGVNPQLLFGIGYRRF